MPNMIVVAILNGDRTHDFTPIHSLLFGGKVDSLRMKTTGGGAQFLTFIQHELVPFIDRQYRTQPYRVLAAHSLGGLFGLYAKEAAPELFQSTILMSPAIYGGNAEILTRFKPFLQTHPTLSGKLFISIGHEDTQTVDSLVAVLRRFSPARLAWTFQKYPDENHFSVTYKSMYDGLKFIYRHWFMDNYNPALLTEKQMVAHFDSLSTEFGYAMTPPEELVNNLGYKQLNAGHLDAAIALFRRNIQNNPTSWNAYDSLAEAYLVKGDKPLAIENYEKSVSLNPANEGGKAALKKLKQITK
ncbi:hypothetical protein GCM10028808_38960 [Spirosoma migulaei]